MARSTSDGPMVTIVRTICAGDLERPFANNRPFKTLARVDFEGLDGPAVGPLGWVEVSDEWGDACKRDGLRVNGGAWEEYE